MRKKEDKSINFFSALWQFLEPIIKELIIYLLVVFAVTVVTYLTKDHLDEKLREPANIIKWIVTIGALALFALHTLAIILIAAIVDIIKKYKKGLISIQNETGKPQRRNSKKRLLSAKSLNSDELSNFANSNTLKREREEKK